MITVRPEDPTTADARRLIDASETELAALYPPEERFAFSVNELVEAGVWFAVARIDGKALGCGGLATYPGYGELKRIFVAPEARGQGLSHAILDALEDRARALGLPVVRLETGIEQEAALGLYRSRGYRDRGPFGENPANGASLFLEKAL